jgi:hypothetical protein
MDLLETIRTGSASVIIIDNLFAGPDLSRISAESRNEFLEALEDDEAVRAQLQSALNVQIDAPRGLLEAALANVRVLWERYAGDPQANHFLFPLFAVVAASNAEVVRLKELAAHLTEFFGRQPETYASLKDAEDALSRCAIAFVDLFIDDSMVLTDTLDLHAAHRERYRHGFDHAREIWPKLVVLISTRLPEEHDLRSFREGAGIRSAFFKPLAKNQISKERIDALLRPWSATYANAALLHKYLDQLSDAVSESADSVRNDLDQIEVHDLALLDAGRLMVEGTSLHSYVGWLTSELLAARARQATANRAGQAPTRAFDGALDTVLLKESVLFDLFADVASSPAETEGRPQFGEILAPTDQMNQPEIPVYVAMSPACDLVRCELSYEVLLVRGRLTALGRNATELLQAGAVFGKGKHFLKYTHEGTPRQGAIQWDYRTGLITRPAGTLSDPANFVRLGRMTELFAYELKDMALSHVSRVGLPVAPSVQRAAAVVVRANFPLGKGVQPLIMRINAPAAPAICALVTRGRLSEDESESGVVVFTDTFRAWFNAEVMPQLEACAAQSAKVDSVVKNIAAWGTWALQFGDDGKAGAPFSDCVVRVLTEAPDDSGRGLDITVVTD